MEEERVRALLECEDSDSNYDDKSDSEAEDALEVQEENTDTEQEGDSSNESEEVSQTSANYYIGKDKTTRWNKKSPSSTVRTRSQNIVMQLPGVKREARNIKDPVDVNSNLMPSYTLVEFTNEIIDNKKSIECVPSIWIDYDDNKELENKKQQSRKKIDASKKHGVNSSPIKSKSGSSLVQRGGCSSPIQLGSGLSLVQQDGSSSPIQQESGLSPVQRGGSSSPTPSSGLSLVQSKNNKNAVQQRRGSTLVQSRNGVNVVQQRSDSSSVQANSSNEVEVSSISNMSDETRYLYVSIKRLTEIMAMKDETEMLRNTIAQMPHTRNGQMFSFVSFIEKYKFKKLQSKEDLEQFESQLNENADFAEDFKNALESLVLPSYKLTIVNICKKVLQRDFAMNCTTLKKSGNKVILKSSKDENSSYYKILLELVCRVNTKDGSIITEADFNKALSSCLSNAKDWDNQRKFR